ncbi:hypothetical protein, partial [Vibrio anguillarum]|uniref:hypothetical protein n=1 Tax=Vibrio anguillarum TaxID=55601 RepID=UPI001BE4B518
NCNAVLPQSALRGLRVALNNMPLLYYNCLAAARQDSKLAARQVKEGRVLNDSAFFVCAVSKRISVPTFTGSAL